MARMNTSQPRPLSSTYSIGSKRDSMPVIAVTTVDFPLPVVPFPSKCPATFSETLISPSRLACEL
ncbi:hypothetical protein R75465_08537 [Paraburkholderia aspalathi]|nr:hypothetical protein R75465_08537 [Paraburkholderia aspalathi]